jgi:hypothetical protein
MKVVIDPRWIRFDELNWTEDQLNQAGRKTTRLLH